MADPPISKLDILSCRNMMTHLESTMERHLLSTFHYALKPTGFLNLGASARTATPTGLFRVVDKT
jgi:two-component system CheB/CheR fusion protein